LSIINCTSFRKYIKKIFISEQYFKTLEDDNFSKITHFDCRL